MNSLFNLLAFFGYSFKVLAIVLISVFCVANVAAQSVSTSQLISLEVINKPDVFVRHLPSSGVRIAKLSTKIDKQDATFILVKGVDTKCADCISFESVNNPGKYLRHQNSRIMLTTLSSDLDKADASFRQVAGLAGKGYSYESSNFPNHFIRTMSNGLLSIAARTEEVAYKNDASFVQKGSQIADIVTGKLSADNIHVFMNPLPFNQTREGYTSGKQAVNLSLTVTPNIHVSNSGSQVIVVDLDGSLLRDQLEGLDENNKKARGWFYEKATVRIVNSSNVQLVKVPKVSNTDEGVMTSSLENTFNVNLSASKDGPSGGVDVTKTENKTFSRIVKGFTLDPPTMNGNVATHTIRMTGCYDGEAGGLKPYNKWEDATDKDKWQSFWDGFIGAFTLENYYGYNVYGLTDPAMGKGLYLPVQAAYLAPKNANGVAFFDIEVIVDLRHIKSEGHTKYDSKLKTETKQFKFWKTVAVNLDMNAYGQSK
ncbi:AbfB domain-containing protein [Runella salmonicolor]|uniref:AbfB domain-containing protein n=1 Tax=Runella salmonicolor TaxID=2950278 RepID=A0ABT1FKL8_9BACT|nr:AbfB domain-containing protein [Runella salmonicolor]MCP1381328.1 AbfB domain-containing protein [Runella salmonicolor]